MPRIAVFVSGSGSNAENIVQHFRQTQTGEVALMVCNNPTAFALQRATRLQVPALVIDKKTFQQKQTLLEILQAQRIDWVVLAGFLLLVPPYLLEAYPQRVINLHPALLPKYGGKGMYGMHVHEAVVANHETETGITIHYANEHYDEGQIILQAKCALDTSDTPETVAQKIHELEYAHFPKAIEQEILKKTTSY
ncbi:MAG: phosphoribosylglycinamide formyltransferase [Bacteroidetes bacterium]|nr:MAG: phosphoribosylglycinamide formyltransferase [Bacteroidota bacterium]